MKLINDKKEKRLAECYNNILYDLESLIEKKKIGYAYPAVFAFQKYQMIYSVKFTLSLNKKLHLRNL